MSNHLPDVIEEKIVEILSTNKIEVKTAENKYKLNFSYTCSQEGEVTHGKTIDIQINITKVNTK